jgi:DNA-binding beta-propeller fold protein YncE
MIHSVKKIVFYAGLWLLASCAPQVADKPVDLVWPNPPETPRIRYIRSLSRANEFGSTGSNWIDIFFGDQSAESMAKPYAASTDRTGRVYVTDTGHGVVWVFDEKAKKVSLLGTSGQGQLKQPIGVAVDNRGIVFVSDVLLQRVYGLDRDGKLVVAIGKKDELKSPSGLAIDTASNRLYVADTRGHNIRVYNTTDGTFLFEFGKRGKEDGEINFPTNLFIRNGKVYVTDTGNFRIQIFDLEGKFLKKLGTVGDALGALARPKGVATDSEGHIYVVDAAFDNFQIFDENGKLYLYVGSAGSGPGFFWLPAGIHIDENDKIYVVDSYNRRVQVFQYLKEKTETGPARVTRVN